MQTFWIQGGAVILPDRIVPDGSVLVAEGRIAAVNEPRPAGVPVVDGGGGYILPGFVDMHVHGGGGADIMDATEDALRTVARTHCAHGTTAMVPTTMTCPDPLLEEVIRCYLRVKGQGTGGAELLGLHLEGPFFSAANKGAQPVTAQRAPERAWLEHILSLAQGEIIRWDAAPELDNMEMFAQVMARHGVLCAIAHTQATAGRAAEAFAWGFSHLTHFYNAMTTFHKVNHRVHAGVIEATYLHDGVTVELIADGRHIPRESMQLAHRIKGADRIALITDAMRAAGTRAEQSVLGPLEGGVPVVIRDGVAHVLDMSVYAGSITTMDAALRTAHLAYGLPLVDVVRMLTLTPARLSLAQHRKGSLQAGKDADILLMTPDFHIDRVFVGGKLMHSNA